MRTGRIALLAAAAGAGAQLAGQVRVSRAQRTPSRSWQRMPVARRGDVRLGVSFRPRQAEAFGLDPDKTLRRLLGYPFAVVRVAAYWNRIESAPGRFCFEELDRQLDAVERAGKQLIVCVGAVKNFGYPEFFVPDHRLPEPLPERTLINRPELRDAAVDMVGELVRRYRDRAAIVAWQVEHEAVDPLGMEHSWRLSEEFVRAEVEAVRAADPGRPVLMNGFLPTSTPVAVSQWWHTRGQGDSLAVACRLADIVGVDVYPRHALTKIGPYTVYLAGARSLGTWWRRRRLVARVAAGGQQLIVCEGQAEPWETDTVPPLGDTVANSCRPEDVIAGYNYCLRWRGPRTGRPNAYLFWGGEYWLARERDGDPSYLRAVERILAES